MAKRPVDDDAAAAEQRALKSGERPVQVAQDHDGDRFEDDYEDEFESEDDMIEAGVDGRPDAEREAEERQGGRQCRSLSSSTDRVRCHGH